MTARPGPPAIVLALAASVAPGTWLALPAAAAAQEDDLSAVLSRAVALHQTGDLEGATALYQQILLAIPDAARIRSNLGAAYAGLGRYEEAIEQYRRALGPGRTDENLAIRQNLALALFKTGKAAEAAQEAARVVEARPANRDAVLLLADCHLRLGEAEAALAALKPFAITYPDDRAVAYLTGTALLALDRLADAQVVMDRVFREDSPEGHVLLGSMLSRRGDWASARAELEKARAGNSKLPLVNFLYGEALMKERSDWAGAAEAFRAELAVDANHFESNLLLGTLLREEGRHAEALEYLGRAARLRGGDPAVKFSLGAAYLATGRLEEAQRLLEDVAKTAPNHLPTQMQLAILYTRLGRKAEADQVRANVVRLQKEADTRSFQGVRDSISDLVGRSAEPPPPPKQP